MSRIDIYFLRAAALYLTVGIGLGTYMGVAQNFQFTTVHAHINLLGWATLGLFGLIYRSFPALKASKLAVWHFWLANLTAVSLILGLFLMNVGIEAAVGLAIFASLTGPVMAALFAIIVFRQTGASAPAAAPAGVPAE